MEKQARSASAQENLEEGWAAVFMEIPMSTTTSTCLDELSTLWSVSGLVWPGHSRCVDCGEILCRATNTTTTTQSAPNSNACPIQRHAAAIMR